MEVKRLDTSCTLDSASAVMSCRHSDVKIDFSFNDYKRTAEPSAMEIIAEQTAVIDGRPTTSIDRYDLSGRRLTDARIWESVFTQEHYDALDAQALEFAPVAQAVEEQFRKFFTAEN